MKNNQIKVAVGISGGVDSAVAVLLLKQAGYQVQGIFMKNWSSHDFGGPCPWAEDQASAQAVAKHLKIPLVTWNFEREYRRSVFDAMIKEYKRGRTPNPDVLCNQTVKFSIFLKKALTQHDLIATGHYARTKNGRLFKAKDLNKDQSYFLSAITKSALNKTLFPLGNLTKPQVRALAKKAKLPNWDRPDSVGICFIGEQKMIGFLSKFIPPKPGNIILADKTIVGRHQGLHFYTIGQRHGLGAGIDQKLLHQHIKPGTPIFIIKKLPATNEIMIAPADKPSLLTAKKVLLSHVRWIDRPKLPWTGRVKLRYRQADVAARLALKHGKYILTLTKPQRAVTPGQYAVFYKGDECLGSAVIEQTIV